MTMIDGVTVLSEEIYGMSPLIIVPISFVIVFGLVWILIALYFIHSEIGNLISGIALALAMLIAIIVFFSFLTFFKFYGII